MIDIDSLTEILDIQNFDELLFLAVSDDETEYPFNLKGITIILGKLGSGKSLLASSFAYILYKELGFKVHSNYPLNFNFNPIYNEETLNKASDGLLIIDEGYTMFDSRRSISNQNIVSTQIIRQSRKKKIRCFIISQLFKLIDVRIRELADTILIPDIYEIDEETEKPLSLKVEVYENDLIGNWSYIDEFVLKVTDEFLGLYDTNLDVYEFEFEDQKKVRKKK